MNLTYFLYPPQIISFVYVSCIVSIVMFVVCFESEDCRLMPMWFIRYDMNFYIHMHRFALYLVFLCTSVFGHKNLLSVHFHFWYMYYIVAYVWSQCICWPHTDLCVWFYFCSLCPDRASCLNFRISVSQQWCPIFVSPLVCIFILHVFQNSLYLWLF